MGVPLNLQDIQSGFLSAASFNSNNTLIEEAMAKALDRTGSSDNAMEADLDMGLNKIFNVTTDTSDETSLLTVADADERYLNTDGDTLTGDINAGGYLITNLGIPSDPNDAARLADVGPDSAATLRTELASSASGEGASLVSMENGETVESGVVKRIPSVAEGIAGRSASDGDVFRVRGWHAGSTVEVAPKGTQILVYVEDEPKANHGLTGWSPTVPAMSEQEGASSVERRDAYLAGDGETDPEGTGLFVIVQETTVPVPVYGAFANGLDDDHGAAQAATDFVESKGSGGVYFPRSKYRLSSDIVCKERGMRFYGDGMENSALLVDGGVTGILIEESDAGSANVFVGIDHLEITTSGEGSGTSRGIRVRSNARKVFISYCRLHEMDYGVLVNDSWSVFILHSHINNNNRNLAVYRTGRDNTSPTTIYCYDNSIMNFVSGKGYSVSIGEPGQDDFQAGEQCSTLVMRENVMDGSHCFQAGATNAHWVRNHAENARIANQPFLLVDGDTPADSQHFKDNIVWDYDFGVAYEGVDYSALNIKGNWFRSITHTAIRVPEAFNDPLLTENNTFTAVGKKYELAIRLSTNEYAEGRSGFEDNDLYLNGNRFHFVTALPSTGRQKHGDQFVVRDDVGNKQSYFFEAGGAAGTALGMTSLGAANETGDTDSGTNTVTPADITAFETGDRLTIIGADTSGGDLDCVVRTIDYVNGTFATNPSIKTDTTGTTIAFTGANSSNFRQIAKGSSEATLDVVGNEQGIVARFKSGAQKTIANGTSVLETLGNRSAFLVYVRDTTNSSSFITAIAATSLSGGFIDTRIDEAGANFSLDMNGLDLELTNNGSSRDYAYTIIRLDSND